MTTVTDPAGYRQIADLLREQIDTGALAPGENLPSESALAQTYGLSMVTVRRALTVLRHEGLIDVRQGYPARVREVGPMTNVDLPATRVWARMPTPADRERWRGEVGEIPDGCPMLVALDVLDEAGRPKAWPAHRYHLRPG
jgi:GntR family transcriptional regulator